jgi:hypothetical protein
MTHPKEKPMAFWNRPESNGDRAIRQHSQAVREQRTQEANDRRMDQGLAPTHCGVQASQNSLGDWECVRCGDTF